MKQNIYTKLSEFTKNFKLNEENYMRKYKEIVGEDYTIMNSEASRDNKSTSKKENFLMEKFCLYLGIFLKKTLLL